jgi:uncharacterized membrane protein
VRILKLVLAAILAALALTAGLVVVVAVVAVVVAALLVRWAMRRLAPGARRRQVPRESRRSAASETTIDVVAVEKPADVLEPPRGPRE